MYNVARVIFVTGALVLGSVSLGHADEGTIKISSATYHDVKSLGRSCNFIKKFACTKDARQCDTITIQNGICDSGPPDPAQGGNKEATIIYTCSWLGDPRPVKRAVVVSEHASVLLSCVNETPLPALAQTITIIKADNGDIGTNRICPFTDAAEARCNHARSCTFQSHDAVPSLNFLCGDPAVGSSSKRAVIQFRCPDRVDQPNLLTHTATARENETLNVSCPSNN
jgi:hypothetical protein